MNLMLAYFDPSAGSLLLQALVGGFGGIAVAWRYFWIQFRGNAYGHSAGSQSEDLQHSVPNASM